MEPKFQTSFIPKNPVVLSSNVTVSAKSSVSIVSLIAWLVFFTAVLTSVGMFFYKDLLNKQIAEYDVALVAARADFEPQQMQDLIDASARILSTKNLLQNHVVVSRLLALLEDLTVKKVSFTSLAYINKNNKPTVAIDFNAQGYNAIAQQENIFKSSEFLKDVDLSGFDLGENGAIKMKFFARVVPDLISYKQSLQNVQSVQGTQNVSASTTQTQI